MGFICVSYLKNVHAWREEREREREICQQYAIVDHASIYSHCVDITDDTLTRLSW